MSQTLKKIIILQHAPDEGPGSLVRVLGELGLPFEVLHSYENSFEFPKLELVLGQINGVISLGGYMSANEDHAHPWIEKELAWLRILIKNDVKIFGICLGGQLVARALGGVVEKNPTPEIGWHLIEWSRRALTLLGKSDELRSIVFQWHRDTFLPPESPELLWLASSNACPRQAFLWKNQILAVQFHPEVTEVEIKSWVGNPEGRADILSQLKSHGPNHVTHPDILENSPKLSFEKSEETLRVLLRFMFE